MSGQRQPNGRAEKINIRINRVPHPNPDEAEDFIARLVVKELVARRATSEGML